MRIAVAAILALILIGGGVARAEDADAVAARQHYKAATGHFAVGEFSDAASEYEAAFKLHQDPALLFNAAQARRLAGENQKALVLYKNFLHLYPSSPNIPVVREQIDKLQEVVAAESTAKTSPPTTTVEPKTEAPGTPATTPPPATTTATTTTPPPSTAAASTNETPPSSEKPPFWKKWWFWTAVGVVVVAAVVIPVAVIESQPAWNNLPAQGPGAPAARGVVPGPNLEVRW